VAGEQAVVSLLWALWLLGCGASEAPPASVAHFRGFPRLVAAAEGGDVSAVRREARDLRDDEVADDPLAEGLGGALGFLQVADADELTEGVAAVARACGACHEAKGVAAPATPPSPAEEAMRGLLWPTGRPGSP
jgi:mono/diheme cytochrome c family protein